jgi:DNA polymerase III epsilon subunit-like protein
MLKFFHTQWNDVPFCVIDTECTGKTPGIDRAVSVGFARFERGELVARIERLVDPQVLIPAEATAIHGITDEMVAGKPMIGDVFREPEVVSILDGAQPAAYNAPFDRNFVPPFGADWTWPWVDVLSIVRKVDRFAKGAGRHKLSAACERHGVTLLDAHSAAADAEATGQLLFKLGQNELPAAYSLGQLIGYCRRSEVDEWCRFNEWLSRQPPREAGAA